VLADGQGEAVQTRSRRVEGANGTEGEASEGGEDAATAVAVSGGVDRDVAWGTAGSGDRVPACGEHSASGTAREAPAPADGRGAPAPGEAGQGARPEGVATGGHDRDAGLDPPVVPRVGGGEVRREQEAQTWTAAEGRGDREAAAGRWPGRTRDGATRGCGTR